MKIDMDNGKVRPVQPVEATNLQLGTRVTRWGGGGGGGERVERDTKQMTQDLGEYKELLSKFWWYNFIRIERFYSNTFLIPVIKN